MAQTNAAPETDTAAGAAAKRLLARRRGRLLRSWRALRLGWLLAGQLAACSPEQRSEPELRNGPLGTLVGEVRLAPGARLPEYAALDTVRRPLQTDVRPPRPSACAQADVAARTPVTVTPDGLLRGVVIAASDFTHPVERRPEQYTVAIEHCRLRPAIITAQGGDVLLLENHDDYPFEPLIGPAYQARPLPRGEQVEVPLAAAGIDSVLCSLGAPCGRTDLLVFFHPVHTISDATGHFRIERFPANEIVRVTAWHPLFEPTEASVWVEPGKQSTIRLQLTPKARFVPAP